jgi:hypothetical protein
MGRSPVSSPRQRNHKQTDENATDCTPHSDCKVASSGLPQACISVSCLRCLPLCLLHLTGLL